MPEQPVEAAAGVILLCFGYPVIVGWWSILLMPITLAIFGLLRVLR